MAASTIVYRATIAEGTRQKWTFSAWLKYDPRDGKATGAGASRQRIIDAGVDTDYFLFLESSSAVIWYSGTYGFTTQRIFKDSSAWYHFVLRVDTTAASGLAAGDRYRFYVNGVEVDTFSSESNPPEAYEGAMNNTGIDMVLGGATTSDHNFMGSMSHVHMCDGYSYAPTEFGETDAASGSWKIKTSPSVSYGTNGFFLKFEDRDNLDLDSGTNAFTFTTSGTLTATYDNPSNNFCVMNIMDNWASNATFTNGDLSVGGSGASGTNAPAVSTMPVSAGKWYWEVNFSGGGIDGLIGIVDKTPEAGATEVGNDANSWGYYGSDGDYRNNNTGTSYGDTFTTGDIIGVYLDLDNNKLYFGKNGSVQNSGTGISITAPSSMFPGYYLAGATYFASVTTTFNYNFGNGYFGTTAVTSAVADEGGIGAFEYDPSAGTFDGGSKDFRAICTKNLKLYGG